MSKRSSVWIGYDPREVNAFAAAKHTAKEFMRIPIPVRGVVLSNLIAAGLYRRPTERRNGQLWDVISDNPMSTEFAISRFLVPHLAREGWALFMDCDMLVRESLEPLFKYADPSKAVMVVKHNHQPKQATKMDNQIQTRYPRKNWSSVMLFNCDHPANKALTIDLINSVPGRDLHRFCWLDDDQIGELDPKWNFLVGHSDPTINPAIVHFTDGIPSMDGYRDVAYADEWWAALEHWAA